MQQSNPYTPQQNGLAERYNRTLLESLRTILEDSQLKKNLWSEVLSACCLTLNQIPAHRSKKSPFELFKGRTIPLAFFHPIGNPVVFLIEPVKSKSKLEPRGERGILIGFDSELLSYKILSPNRGIVHSQSVQFLDFPP